MEKFVSKMIKSLSIGMNIAYQRISMDPMKFQCVTYFRQTLKLWLIIHIVSGFLIRLKYHKNNNYIKLVMLASVPFLLITLIVFGWISKLRNLPGKCLMCYDFCLLIFCIQFPLTLIYQNKILQNHPILCKVSGYMEITILLMSFLWLNVMCYDVWSTIRYDQT